MTEGSYFAINGIFDGADLEDEKAEKVMYRVWFSALVLVKSRSEEWSSFATLIFSRVDAVTEPSVEVDTP